MWHIINEKDAKAQKEAWAMQWESSLEEARKKAEEKEEFIKANTCPHCGQCPPLPPWLMY